MRLPAVLCLLALPAALSGQTLEPGTGAPTDAIREQFQTAFSRGIFPTIASPTPQGTVARFGTTGLRQLFTDTTRSGGGTLALVRASSLNGTDVSSVPTWQVLTDMWAYYNSVGVSTAGYPTRDTQFCSNSACTWQTFDKRYALFAYTSGANDTQNVTVRDPFYTKWDTLGGMNTLGPATTAETAVTSSFGGNATSQAFANGVLFNITSGALSGRLVSVRQPVYDLYLARGGVTGSLGLPTADAQTLANGKKRQIFEGGSIDFDDNSPPVLRTPVSAISLRPSATPVRMNAGDSFVLTATVVGTDGTELQDRVVNFITSNSRVVAIQTSGLTATVRAVGGGTARLTATSEGKMSVPVDIIVSSVCCAVGEGAPTTAISQAMIDAVARTKVQLRLPGPERVRRAGSGYVQEFQSADPASALRYLVAIADKSAQAFVVGGAVLMRYEQLGGTAGSAGFPVGDAASSGRQEFEKGVLAGAPPHFVSGAILTKWAAAGYESGAAGTPTGEAVQGTSFTASAGISQAFSGGLFVAGPKGAFLVSGIAAEYYLDQGGILSPLGLPVADESVSGVVHRQEFEGGTLEYADANDIRFTPRPRTPAISVTPASPLPGSRVRIAVSGFPDQTTLRVSATGQADFVVPTVNGSYVWDISVPANAAAGTVTLRAVDTAQGGASATATYTVRTFAQARVTLNIVSGDTQSGAPGSTLPAPLRVQVRDERSTPISGLTVSFNASPGASVSRSTAVTDSSGFAETVLTLPNFDGVALATAEAAGQVKTFSARAAGGSIASFPRLTVASGDVDTPGGALLASAASIIRYLQLRGDLKNPNGMADVATLSDYLMRTCTTDGQGLQICDGFFTAPNSRSKIANLWRLAGFVGGNLDVSVERTTLDSIRAFVAGGSPVLIALSMPAGAHFVVATGIASDGGIQIHDPRTQFGRTKLGDYLDGFDASGSTWKATITGAVRLLPRTPVASSFVITSASPILISSAAGECGLLLEWPDREVRPDGSAASVDVFRMRACAGTADEYQLETGSTGEFRATVTDLADGGSRSELAGSGVGAFRVYRPGTWLGVTPQEAVLSASPVVNAATFTPDIAAGGLITVRGNGLARSGEQSVIDVGGRAATVIESTPFSITAQVPADVTPGINVLRVQSPYGVVEQTVDVRPYAPALFRIVNTTGNRLNSSESPVSRGQSVSIYATGLGLTNMSGSVNPTVVPVTVVISGQELRPSYAGLASGYPGVYQVNLVIPATFPPGLDQTLTLREGNVESAPVGISIQ